MKLQTKEELEKIKDEIDKLIEKNNNLPLSFCFF